MKLKKKIKLLKAKIKELETVITKDSIILTDECNQNVKVVISFKNGVFSTEKLTANTQTEIITKDQSK